MMMPNISPKLITQLKKIVPNTLQFTKHCYKPYQPPEFYYTYLLNPICNCKTVQAWFIIINIK